MRQHLTLTLRSLLRTALGLLTLGAIGWQLRIHVRMGFDVVNFFSYFTNLSNLLAALVLLQGGYRVFRRADSRQPGDALRLVAAVNMAVVGVVFAILLRDVDLGSLLPWINFLLHEVMPCVLLLDWLLQLPTARLGWRPLLACLVFPALYLAYVLVRGAATQWYPYPFLNPATVGGYGDVALYAAGITAAFMLAAIMLWAAGNQLAARRPTLYPPAG